MVLQVQMENIEIYNEALHMESIIPQDLSTPELPILQAFIGTESPMHDMLIGFFEYKGNVYKFSAHQGHMQTIDQIQITDPYNRRKDIPTDFGRRAFIADETIDSLNKIHDEEAVLLRGLMNNISRYWDEYIEHKERPDEERE